MQSPDSAKVKEGLNRLQKRLKAEKKNVEEKEKKYQEQKEQIARLQTDLKNIKDGEFAAAMHTTFVMHLLHVHQYVSMHTHIYASLYFLKAC